MWPEFKNPDDFQWKPKSMDLSSGYTSARANAYDSRGLSDKEKDDRKVMSKRGRALSKRVSSRSLCRCVQWLFWGKVNCKVLPDNDTRAGDQADRVSNVKAYVSAPNQVSSLQTVIFPSTAAL